MAEVRMELVRRAHSTVLKLVGTLGPRSHAIVRDGLLKAATEAPDGLIADVSELGFTRDAQLTVFALVAMRLGDWPGIPFALVTRHPDQAEVLRRSPVARYARVHGSAADAERRFGDPVRRQAVREFPRAGTTSSSAREFVTETCRAWGIPELADDAAAIVTEFVENTLQHTGSRPEVRVDLRRGICTVAVADEDPLPAELRERDTATEPGLGLQLVAQFARGWGCSRSWSGGKVVWATLRVPRDTGRITTPRSEKNRDSREW
ncbi:ATP-binding protein [Amycolatopsis rifamycinica]|uniref:Anti-anti-sigma factor n=1 Tax=Amycolatopsis rifamycinica TaxID=287986 RepID=A0A066U556_9PSEU|nr:ATP-binding protein [Amycolatopsis rifamycinica]KDN22591.1 anti-anti-sigma factor [Amycolatopsis rifamycinica]